MRDPWNSCGVGLAGAALFASLAGAAVVAQAPAQTPTPPPIQAPAPGPYTPVPITLPPAVNDPSFDAFRQGLAEIAQKKDRAALARLVTANFFWIPEDTDLADKRKSGIDNLAKALGLEGPDAIGWDALAAYAAEASAMADPQRKGVFCAPSEPVFDEKAADELANATHTDAADWVFPLRDGVEVRAEAKQDAPVVDKLGLYLVRELRQGDAAVGQDRLRAGRDGAADRRRATVLRQGRERLEDRGLSRRRAQSLGGAIHDHRKS